LLTLFHKVAQDEDVATGELNATLSEPKGNAKGGTMADPISTIQDRFLQAAFSSNPALRGHSSEESQLIARNLLSKMRGVREIEAEMRQRGLISTLTRAKAYSPFSRKAVGPRVIAIVPHVSPDPAATLVGGIGLTDTENEPASGIVVRLADRTRVVEVTALDFIGGRLVTRVMPAAELIQGGLEKFVEDTPRTPIEPVHTIDTVGLVAGDAYSALIVDDFAKSIYTAAEIQQLAHNMPLVMAIAQLQHMRHLGVPTAASCCCCSTCSWGCSCSSSAMASGYVNHSYLASLAEMGIFGPKSVD
jgi:hypothetical protein